MKSKSLFTALATSALVAGVASASAVPGTPAHHAEYNLIRIDPAQRRFELVRRGFRHGVEGIGTLAHATFPPVRI